ncbi:MAG TPA: hypothetical protein VGA27_12680 [Candidatus Binatia bacterium]
MTTPTIQRFVPLLIPQRVDGIQTRRFLGGIKTKEHADGDVSETNKNVERYSETADCQ